LEQRPRGDYGRKKGKNSKNQGDKSSATLEKPAGIGPLIAKEKRHGKQLTADLSEGGRRIATVEKIFLSSPNGQREEIPASHGEK